MVGLPRGIQVLRADECIESVRTERNEIRLLGHGDGTEVWRQQIRPGGSFTIAPAKDWDALEFIHVLSGTLAVDSGEAMFELGPGDLVSARHIERAARFVAKTEVTIVYVCSQPTFHAVSRLGKELMELAVTVERLDGYTAEHCRRIRDLSLGSAEQLGLSPWETMLLGYAAFLHDLGKAKVPEEILGKEGALSPQEWEIMRLHPKFGREMLDGTCLADAGPIVEQHHECLDGSGYPYGLRGDEISIEAQIIAVVDTFDSLTSDRPYRKALPAEVVLDRLRTCSGVLWKHEVGEATLKVLSEWSQREVGSCRES